jgi:hypothetical protein
MPGARDVLRGQEMHDPGWEAMRKPGTREGN